MQKQCKQCNSIYTKGVFVCSKQWAKSKYCSNKCQYNSRKGKEAHNNNQVGVICKTCKKGFMVSPYRKDIAKFCSLKCHGVTRVGEKGINWRGGITPINRAIRASETYREWRKAVYERDNYTCTSCGERGGKLEADHIKRFSLYPKLRFEVSNGQTLCKPCHKLKTVFEQKKYWVNQFSKSEAMN